MLQYSTATNHCDILQQPLAVAFLNSQKLRAAAPSRGQRLHSLQRCAAKAGVFTKRRERTQGEDVGATGAGHVVLLDGLVERGLAQQQEAEANPHGQQPGHGRAESAGRHTAGGKQTGELCITACLHKYLQNTLCSL